MKKASFLTATIFFFCIINQFCSQSPGPAKNSKKMNYVATTPCTEEIKQMLGIINTECEMMKWRLTLEKDDKDIPSTFQLSYTSGMLSIKASTLEEFCLVLISAGLPIIFLLDWYSHKYINN